MMKQFIRLSFLVLCTVFLFNSFAHAEALDRIVAIVNDAPVMQSELNTALDNIKKQAAATGSPLPPQAELHKQVLTQLINRKLQLQVAEQSGVRVSDEDITRAIGNIAKENNMTTAQLYQKVASENISQANYRKEIREEMTLQKIQQQEVGSKINITPEEIKQAARRSAPPAASTKEYHLEDILVAFPDTSSPQAIADTKKQAEAILAKARQGTPFNTLNSSDLGWRPLAEIPSAFADKLSGTKSGEIIGPIQAKNGFHILHLVGVRNAKTASTGEQQNNLPPEKQAEEMLYQKKYSAALDRWIIKLRGEAVINMHPDN